MSGLEDYLSSFLSLIYVGVMVELSFNAFPNAIIIHLAGRRADYQYT
jgi:hypothetical protein